MTTRTLDKFFSPRSIAVVGASDTPGHVGYVVIRNLVAGGFQGRIFPVNPGREKINGIKAFPDLATIGEVIDLAVIATPIEAVPAVIEDGARAGVDSAIIFSAGGKETGAAGEQLESEILEAARQGGLRIIGPNCVGVISTAAGLNTSFLNRLPPAGEIAFISQSGGMCLAILDRAARERIGFRHFVSIGSMLDVDFGDMLNHCCGDTGVRAIVLYVESITRARKFMSAARAVSRIKPIIVLKAGRSQAGAAAAYSHTGALAGADDVYRAAFARAGITQVDTIEELFDCTELIAKQPLPSGPRLAVITNGGGPGVMAMDAIERMELQPARLSEETMARLDAVLPAFWSRGNPIDIIGDASPERWRQTVEICAMDPGINGLIIIFIPQALSNAGAVSDAVIDYLKQKPKFPVFAVWMGGESVDRAVYRFNAQGYPTFETPERAVAAFQRLYTHRARQKMLQEIPGRFSAELTINHKRAREWVDQMLLDGHHSLGEIEAKPILAAYGIPVNPAKLARTPTEAVRLADRIGYPVVLKIVSPDIVHKSEAGGICLSIKNAEAVRISYDQLIANAAREQPRARITGVSVQPMLFGANYELILGSRRDPVFGPVIVFGAGGIFTEILHDRAIGLPPLNRALARQLIERTRIAALLKGYRRQPAVPLEHLEEILIRLSRLVIDFPEIAELDINPAIVVGGRLRAADARIRLEPALEKTPAHLVISPYPHHLEERAVTHGGLHLLIRPIKPEDAPLFSELFSNLSPESNYFRFFGLLKRIPPEMLARFTQIDYDRDMALVAIAKSAQAEEMLGAARLIREPSLTRAEFSVMVADAMHGQGIGAALLRKLIAV
ncbi:MAG: bifunctional acetate--CoA ligase family protein/GNAT family N-acetyltransferase, partial [Desulfosarcina sp.]|nr:bifunctional acetate--CoA ligase family protein/GNAT family N-acetyltransferase [Desulfobacterales bacterium]